MIACRHPLDRYTVCVAVVDGAWQEKHTASLAIHACALFIWQRRQTEWFGAAVNWSKPNEHT